MYQTCINKNKNMQLLLLLILTFQKAARLLIEYGADKEVHWTGEKFVANVERAAKITETLDCVVV